MKRSLSLILIKWILIIVCFFQSNINVYGGNILHKKGNITIVKSSLDKITDTVPTLHIDLYLLNPDSTTIAADGAVAQYDSVFCACVDYMDAPKFTNLNENFSIIRDGHLLSIERRPIIHIRDTLFFNLTQTTQRSYQLRFTPALLSQPGLFCFLKDSYTGDSTFVDLGNLSIYNFNINNTTASQNPNRFMLVFEPLAEGGVVPVTFISIKAWQQNGNIALQWKVENETNIQNYSIERSFNGSAFTSIAIIKSNRNGSSNIYNWIDTNAIPGQYTYRVQSIGIDGTVEYSQETEVNDVMNADGHISIYPNPTKDGIVRLVFANMPEGVYQLRMLNNTGQFLNTMQINHNGSNSSYTMNFGIGIPKGLYELQVIQPDNSRITYNIQYQ